MSMNLIQNLHCEVIFEGMIYVVQWQVTGWLFDLATQLACVQLQPLKESVTKLKLSLEASAYDSEAKGLRSVAAMSEFDSSDDENNGEVDLSPFKISWLDVLECSEKLGICGLPGCRFKDTWRSLEHDIRYLVNEEVQEVFSLCTKGELNKYRVPSLLQEITSVNIAVHHYPFPDGQIPCMQNLMKMTDEIYAGLVNGKKTIIHCFGGLGRSCLVAVCLLMVTDEGLSAEAAISKVRDLRGPGAIQSVKQYNFVCEFREHLATYKKNQADEIQRSISR